MIEKYLDYIAYLTRNLNKYFEAQEPYIFCKRGCAKCCQSGEYPFSRLEFDFINIGYYQLQPDLRQNVQSKILKLKQEKSESKEQVFMYECPFLINNECSVYNYRGIICRTFGLISSAEGGEPSKIPFCAYQGLNYSNVLDTETNIISEEKFLKLKTDKQPLVYNVSYKFLTGKTVEDTFGIKFGEKRPLLDWF